MNIKLHNLVESFFQQEGLPFRVSGAFHGILDGKNNYRGVVWNEGYVMIFRNPKLHVPHENIAAARPDFFERLRSLLLKNQQVSVPTMLLRIADDNV